MKGNITPMNRNSRILVAALTAGLVLLTSFPGRTDSGGIPNENAKGYWTQDRMRNAIPIELVVDQKTGIGTIQPAAGKKSNNTGSTPTSTIFQNTSTWDFDDKAQTAYGKVFFTAGRYDYVCSGALVRETDSERAIVLTAAHCVWDQATRRFVTNWMFQPNYYKNPGGNKWYSTALVVRDEFASQTRFNTTALLHDWAFAVLLKGNLNPTSLPDANNNSYPLNIDGFTNGLNSVAFGYPAGLPYEGFKLIVAGASRFLDPNTNGTWGMASDMTGGASGGPWLSNGTSSTVSEFVSSGSFSSLNSYKYTVDPTKMYGPRFNSKTSITFDNASTVQGNTRVK